MRSPFLGVPAGNLDTTLHPLVAGPGVLSAASNVSRDRGIFELDWRYRQVDPPKTPSPSISDPQGTTGLGFASFNGDSRFFLTDGDAVFFSSPSDDSDFLLRASDGSSTLMTDASVHSGTDQWTGRSFLWQYQKDIFIANPSFVRRLSVESPGSDNGLVAKSYDPSLYTPYESLQDNYTAQGYSGTTISLLTTASGTFVVAPDGSNFSLSDNHANGADVGAGYNFKVVWGSAISIPTGTEWLIIPVTRQTAGASFMGYGGTVDPSASPPGVYNSAYSNGKTPQLLFGTGSGTRYGGKQYFITLGNTQYLIASLNASVGSSFDTMEVWFWCQEDANEKFTFGKLYMIAAPLIDDLDSGTTETGDLAGFGPVYESTDYVNYAFRGSDSGRSSFGPATLAQIPQSQFYNQAFWGTAIPVPTGPPAMPEKVILTTGGAVVPGGYADVQFLRLGPNGIWYEIGLVTNTGSPSVTDTHTITQLEALSHSYPNATFSGTATSGTFDTLVDSAQNWGTNCWVGGTLTVSPAGRQVQVSTISSNTATTISLSGVITPPIDGTPYKISLSSGLSITAQPLTGITAGCEWKNHCCYGRNDGYVIFASQVNFDTFILPEYTDGFTGLVTDTTQPIYKPVSGQAEPILAMHGRDALYLLARRSAYCMTGSNGITAAGPFRISGFPGLVSPFGSCPYQSGVLAASDDGLYYIEHPELYVAKSIASNLTRQALRQSWLDLIGDNDERTRVVIVQGDGHIWCFRDDQYLHMSPMGLWTSGTWATGALVVAAAVDYAGRVCLGFSDTSVGYIDQFPTDGGVTVSGLDGTQVTWSVQKRFRGPLKPVRVNCEIETDPGSSSEAKVFFASELVRDPIEVPFEDIPLNRPVQAWDWVIAERWLNVTLQGSGANRLLFAEIEIAPAGDGRARR